MNAKQLVIASYSDLSKLSPEIKSIHFRKFVSKKLLKIVAEKFPKLKIISVSKYAAKRLPSEARSRFLIQISVRKGRPNILEK